MYGANGTGAAILFLALFYASATVAAACALATFILVFTAQRRTGFVTGGLALVIVAGWAILYFRFRPPTPKDYTIEVQIPSNRAFPGFPGGRVKDIGRAEEHQIWGNLSLHITLPDGRTITGTAERATVQVEPEGIRYLTLFYNPSKAQDILSYWEEGGIPSDYRPMGGILVDRGEYSVQVYPTKNGSYYLQLEWPPDPRSKKKRPAKSQPTVGSPITKDAGG